MLTCFMAAQVKSSLRALQRFSHFWANKWFTVMRKKNLKNALQHCQENAGSCSFMGKVSQPKLTNYKLDESRPITEAEDIKICTSQKAGRLHSCLATPKVTVAVWLRSSPDCPVGAFDCTGTLLCLKLKHPIFLCTPGKMSSLKSPHMDA